MRVYKNDFPFTMISKLVIDVTILIISDKNHKDI